MVGQREFCHFDSRSDEGFGSFVVEDFVFGDNAFGVGDGDVADGGDAEYGVVKGDGEDDGNAAYICSIVAIGRKSRLGIPGNARNPYFW
jgi:hypothetical protein